MNLNGQRRVIIDPQAVILVLLLYKDAKHDQKILMCGQEIHGAGRTEGSDVGGRRESSVLCSYDKSCFCEFVEDIKKGSAVGERRASKV